MTDDDSSRPEQLTDLAADLILARELANQADAITTERFLANDLRVETKPDLSPVTEADQAVERALRATIETARPSDQIIGEEYGGLPDGQLPEGRIWIIDPIDGTKNFVRGVPIWATLIGLVVDRVPTLGFVSAPALGRRWWAHLGGGAWTQTALPGMSDNPRQIHVSAVADLTDASLSSSDEGYWEAVSPTGLAKITDAVWRSRAYGDFYSHLLVAEGAVDIAPEAALNMWDIAALIPIVQEAGGSVVGLDGSDALTAGSALTTNGLLEGATRNLL